MHISQALAVFGLPEYCFINGELVHFEHEYASKAIRARGSGVGGIAGRVRLQCDGAAFRAGEIGAE